MFKTSVNQQFQFDITLNDPNFDWDVLQIEEGQFHILKNHQSYNATLVQANWKNKTIVIQVNGTNYTVQLKDKMDILLEKMGINNLASNKINELVAPMPGLVLDIQVKIGDELQKGDVMLVLEAMKMENVLKSPGEGIVKSIDVQQGDAVEKGQVLVRFE